MGRLGLVSLLVFFLACSDGGAQEGSSSSRSVVGVVVHVESSGSGAVESFTVEDGEDTTEIFIDPKSRTGSHPAI